jgi:hypothetical protein
MSLRRTSLTAALTTLRHIVPSSPRLPESVRTAEFMPLCLAILDIQTDLQPPGGLPGDHDPRDPQRADAHLGQEQSLYLGAENPAQ